MTQSITDLLNQSAQSQIAIFQAFGCDDYRYGITDNTECYWAYNGRKVVWAETEAALREGIETGEGKETWDSSVDEEFNYEGYTALVTDPQDGRGFDLNIFDSAKRIDIDIDDF